MDLHGHSLTPSVYPSACVPLALRASHAWWLDWMFRVWPSRVDPRHSVLRVHFHSAPARALKPAAMVRCTPFITDTSLFTTICALSHCALTVFSLALLSRFALSLCSLTVFSLCALSRCALSLCSPTPCFLHTHSTSHVDVGPNKLKSSRFVPLNST